MQYRNITVWNNDASASIFHNFGMDTFHLETVKFKNIMIARCILYNVRYFF